MTPSADVARGLATLGVDGWARLADQAEVLMGQSPPSSSCSEDGDGLPFIQGNAEFGRRSPLPRLRCTSPARVAEAGDLLLSVRAPVGALNQATERTVIGRGLSALRFRAADQRFAWHAVSYAAPSLNRVAQGSTFVAVSRKDVECMVLPWHDEANPAIAAVLDTVDEMIEKTEAVIAKLRQVRTGLLHDLLACGLDENGQLRDPVAHPEQFQDSPIGLIPKAWEIRTVGQLIAGFESGVSVDSVDTPAAEGEIGVLKTGCITGGVFVLQENKRVKTQDLGRVRCNPKEDCLIISRMNTPQLVGESAYVSLDCEYVYLPDRLWQTIKYPGDPTCIRWLGYVVQEKEFREAVTGGATGTSGSMKNITQSFFLSLPVRVPPRQEQELIAKLAVHHDARITTEQDYRNKLTQLKSGLMDDLLTGRVRIPEGID